MNDRKIEPGSWGEGYRAGYAQALADASDAGLITYRCERHEMLYQRPEGSPAGCPYCECERLEALLSAIRDMRSAGWPEGAIDEALRLERAEREPLRPGAIVRGPAGQLGIVESVRMRDVRVRVGTRVQTWSSACPVVGYAAGRVDADGPVQEGIRLRRCEDCEQEYEEHHLALPPLLCAECEAAREDQYLDEQDEGGTDR